MAPEDVICKKCGETQRTHSITGKLKPAAAESGLAAGDGQTPSAGSATAHEIEEARLALWQEADEAALRYMGDRHKDDVFAHTWVRLAYREGYMSAKSPNAAVSDRLPQEKHE